MRTTESTDWIGNQSQNTDILGNLEILAWKRRIYGHPTRRQSLPVQVGGSCPE